MGCTGSTDNPKLLHDLEELKEYLRQQELKATEQQNLLRFKIEVLVNMLAVEEKRSELTSKRLETLKWLIHSQGVTEETITKILNNLEKEGKLSLDQSVVSVTNQFQSMQLIDLSGAIQRMQDEFKLYSNDLLHAYALNNGKIMTTLPLKEFIEQTYNITEKITKLDLKLIAMRFDDGYGNVCIPELLEFFMTNHEIRNMKISERAVKMSLDLFSLDVELLNEDEEEDNNNHEEGGRGDPTLGKGQGKDNDILRKSILKDEALLYDDYHGPEMRKSHFTRSLDRGAKRLLVMWVYVRQDLHKTFQFYQKAQMIIKDTPESKSNTKDNKNLPKKDGIAAREEMGDKLREDGGELNEEDKDAEEIITVEIFQKSVEEVCGKFSMVLEKEAKEGIIQLVNNTEMKVKPDILNKTTVNDPTKNKENKAPQPSNTPNKPNSNTPNNSKPNNPQSLSRANSSTNATKDIPPPPQIIPLDSEDIQFLIDRFEISGFIHYLHFMQFFNDLYDRWMKYAKKFTHIPDDWMDVTPFRLSTEWNTLKQTSVLQQSYQQSQEKSKQSIDKSKDRLSTSKSFTAPKKLPPSTEKKVEDPKAKEDENKKPEDKDKSKPEEKKDDKDKEKKEEEKKTAPVVEQSGCFGCGGNKAKPLNPPSDADEKNKDKNKKDDKGKKSNKDDEDNDDKGKKKGLKIETDSIADGKTEGSDDGLQLKRDDSFDTPKNLARKPAPKFDRFDSGHGNMIEREGLGNGDTEPEIKDRTRRGRFRRRADRDFDQEKPEMDDDVEDDLRK